MKIGNKKGFKLEGRESRYADDTLLIASGNLGLGVKELKVLLSRLESIRAQYMVFKSIITKPK